MTVLDFLDSTDLEQSLLIGYYGGGNYGDELLLEVLQNLLDQKGVQRAAIAFQNPNNFSQLHHFFGYHPFDIHNKPLLVKTALRQKNIIVGGGGLWGLDMNFNTFLMSVFLFVCRRVLRKKVYLVGVGYYDSTTMLGRLGAFMAAKAANRIIARDNESFLNFQKINKHTEQDTDLAWYVKQIDLSSYDEDVRKLEQQLNVTGKDLFISTRRFQTKHENNFSNLISDRIAANADKGVVAALLELSSVDKESYDQIKTWQGQYQNVQLLDMPYNPLALFAFFQKYHGQLAVIAPQFHLIITAYLTGVPFFPVVYDNKVSQLLTAIGIGTDKQFPINELSSGDIQAFINRFFGK